jgi:hypothetical protein
MKWEDIVQQQDKLNPTKDWLGNNPGVVEALEQLKKNNMNKK